MKKFESSIKQVPYSQEAVYRNISDLRNLEKVRDRVPEDKTNEWVYLRVTFNKDALCTFYFSEDGKHWAKKDTFQAVEGQWIGAKVGLFCTRNRQINDVGWLDVDWFRITK